MTGLRLSVRSFHKPLADAGLVPENCRVMDIVIGVDGAFTVKYEVFFTAEQVDKLGDVFKLVAAPSLQPKTDD